MVETFLLGKKPRCLDLCPVPLAGSRSMGSRSFFFLFHVGGVTTPTWNRAQVH